MEINLQSHQEQIIRTVSQVGNGAHIFAPKEWINEKVLIVRLEKKSIKEEILQRIYPHLDKIMGVFLYGSQARGEAIEDSDVDVLIIAREKFKIVKEEKFKFIVISEASLNSSINTNPIMMYSIFKEAKAIINDEYLNKLRQIKINPGLFKSFIQSTKESIKSDEEIIELDKKTGKTISNSVIYSLILRLRGIFIIKSLLNKERYSNFLFKTWLNHNCKIDYEEVYSIYQALRSGKELKDKAPIEFGESLLDLLKEELKELGQLINKHGKKKKEA
jgi:predicted nucleotidyltransferase